MAKVQILKKVVDSGLTVQLQEGPLVFTVSISSKKGSPLFWHEPEAPTLNMLKVADALAEEFQALAKKGTPIRLRDGTLVPFEEFYILCIEFQTIFWSRVFFDRYDPELASRKDALDNSVENLRLAATGSADFDPSLWPEQQLKLLLNKGMVNADGELTPTFKAVMINAFDGGLIVNPFSE